MVRAIYFGDNGSLRVAVEGCSGEVSAVIGAVAGSAGVVESVVGVGGTDECAGGDVGVVAYRGWSSFWDGESGARSATVGSGGFAAEFDRPILAGAGGSVCDSVDIGRATVGRCRICSGDQFVCRDGGVRGGVVAGVSPIIESCDGEVPKVASTEALGVDSSQVIVDSDCLGVGSSGKSVPVEGVMRGRHYERNRSRREKVKAARGAVGHLGFFSRSTEVVQEELRESRAKLLVLENKRKAVQEQRKIDRLSSPMQVVEDAVAMVKMAGSYAKLSADSRVAGWAKTLAESSAESIARSAPDSLESLDSVTSARELGLKKSVVSGDAPVGAASSRVSSRSRSDVKAESSLGTRLGGRRVLPGELVRASVLDSGPNFALPSWMEEY